jgi:hypothetical protein
MFISILNVKLNCSFMYQQSRASDEIIEEMKGNNSEGNPTSYDDAVESDTGDFNDSVEIIPETVVSPNAEQTDRANNDLEESTSKPPTSDNDNRILELQRQLLLEKKKSRRLQSKLFLNILFPGSLLTILLYL